MNTARPRELPVLTSYRFFAAFWVVLFHLHGRVDFGEGGFAQIVQNGARGVDFFFILSGFVIFHVYGANARAGDFSFRSYILKRINRIYPLHLVMLLIFVASGWIGSLTGEVRGLEFSAWDALASGSLLHAWAVTDGLVLNGPSWTISAELFAYALFGLVALVWGTYLRPVPVALAYITSFITVHVFARWLGHGSFVHLTWDFGTLRIVPCFLLGMLLRMAAEKTAGPLSAVLCLLGVISFAVLARIEDVAYVILIPFSLLILAGLKLPETPWNPFFWRATKYLGEVSYSVYMVHIFVILIYFEYLPKVIGVVFTGTGWDIPAVLGLVLASSAVGYHLIERPARMVLNQRVLATTGHKKMQDGH